MIVLGVMLVMVFGLLAAVLAGTGEPATAPVSEEPDWWDDPEWEWPAWEPRWWGDEQESPRLILEQVI